MYSSIEKYCDVALDKDDKLGSYKPTHVVTAITYGGDAHFEFKKVS